MSRVTLLSRQTTRHFDPDEIWAKTMLTLTDLAFVQKIHGGWMPAHLLGQIIERQAWSSNEGFMIHKLLLKNNWLKGNVPKRCRKPGAPVLYMVTPRGVEAVKPSQSILNEEEVIEMIAEVTSNPPPPLSISLSSSSKGQRKREYAISDEEGSPINEEALNNLF